MAPFPPAAAAEALFDAAEQALAEGRGEEALALAGRLETEAPGEPAVAALKAAALALLGRVEQAEQTLAAARKRHPEELELLFAHAELLVLGSGEDRPRVEEGLTLCARGVKQARKRRNEALLFDFLLMEGLGRNQLGECEAALESLEAALELEPDSVEARLEQAQALFELCRFEKARGVLEAWVHHTLGLLAERRKDMKAARRHFKRAQQLAPEDFPPAVSLGEKEFDAAVEDALARLPEHVKQYLENTTIAVEPVPSDEDLLGASPPLSPVILGVFRGTPVGERSISNAADHFPCSIVLYQRNLERFARTREELIEQIGITVMHEVGHLIGLDEEDLWERGLE
jgi:predicted Zn-dependent protease with MMP-like domain/Flp pilus assembly protein TadD